MKKPILSVFMILLTITVARHETLKAADQKSQSNNKTFHSPDVFSSSDTANYIIHLYSLKLKINPDASIDAEEIFDMEFTNPSPSFTRFFNNDTQHRGRCDKARMIILDDISLLNSKNNTAYRASWKSYGEGRYISFTSDSLFNGHHRFAVKYKIWGAFCSCKTGDFLEMTILNELLSEVVKKIDVSLLFTPGTEVPGNSIGFFTHQDIPVRIELKNLSGENACVFGQSFTPDKGNSVKLRIRFLPGQIRFDRQHAAVYSKDYYVRDFNSELRVMSNGMVDVCQEYRVKFACDSTGKVPFTAYIRYIFPENPDDFENLNYSLPHWALLGNVYKVLVKDLNISGIYRFGNDKTGMKRIIEWIENENLTDSGFYRIEYSIYSLIRKEGSRCYLEFPLSCLIPEPAAAGSFSIVFPDASHPGTMKFEAFVEGKNTCPEKVPLLINGNKISGRLNHGLMAGQTVVIRGEFPSSYISSRDTASDIPRNNIYCP